MNTLWNNDLELKFLEYYRGEPIIWDANYPQYKDKSKNNEAWAGISAKMGIPVADLKRKRDSLLSSYRKYRKIVRDSVNSGAGESELYKPMWFAYEIMESFLGNRQGGKKTTNTISNKEQNHIEDEEKPIINDDVSNTLPWITTKQTKRRRRNPPELKEARSFVKQAINTLNTALQKQQTPEENCDLYGKIVANRLRKLSETEQDEIMYEIEGLFLRRKAVRSQCQNVCPIPSPSAFYSEPIPQGRAYSNAPTDSEPPSAFLVSEEAGTSGSNIKSNEII